jgi:hypothetical protein
MHAAENVELEFGRPTLVGRMFGRSGQRRRRDVARDALRVPYVRRLEGPLRQREVIGFARLAPRRS